MISLCRRFPSFALRDLWTKYFLMSENQMIKMIGTDDNFGVQSSKRPIYLHTQSSQDLTSRSVTGIFLVEERVAHKISLSQDQRTRSFSAASHSTFTSPKKCKDDGVKLKEERVRQRLCSMRKWEYTHLGKEFKKEEVLRPNHQSVKFTVLSFNVLAQDLLVEHTYLYKHVDLDTLVWEKRACRILREVVDSDADVICLQEVQASHYGTFFTPQLSKLGFEGVYKKRTGDKPDGCAIFWRQTKFDLKYSTFVEYYKPNVHILDRDNIALIVLLAPKSTSQSKRSKRNSSISIHQEPVICVATTHLLYNPKRHDIKIAQLQMLFAELDRIAYQSGSSSKSHVYHPVILTGDFNLTPDTLAYQFITNGALQYKGLGKDLNPSVRGQVLNKELIPRYLNVTDQCQHLDVTLNRDQGNMLCPSKKNVETDSSITSSAKFASGELSHQLKLQSVYPHVLHRLKGAKEVTTYQNDWVTVDYIFYNTEQTNSSLRLVSRLGLLAGKEMGIVGGLPSLASPSDHLPLAASFIWNYD